MNIQRLVSAKNANNEIAIQLFVDGLESNTNDITPSVDRKGNNEVTLKLEVQNQSNNMEATAKRTIDRNLRNIFIQPDEAGVIGTIDELTTYLGTDTDDYSMVKRDVFTQLKGHTYVAKAMTIWPYESIQIAAMDLLCNSLILASMDIHNNVLNEGILQCVFKAIITCSENEEVVERGCECFDHLIWFRDDLSKIFHDNAVYRIIHVMTNFPFNDVIQKWCCWMLFEILAEEKGYGYFQYTEASSLLSAAIENFREDTENAKFIFSKAFAARKYIEEFSSVTNQFQNAKSHGSKFNKKKTTRKNLRETSIDDDESHCQEDEQSVDDSEGSDEDTAAETVDSSALEYTTEELKRKEKFRPLVEALVRKACPKEISNTKRMMNDFVGQEEDLIETLRNMVEDHRSFEKGILPDDDILLASATAERKQDSEGRKTERIKNTDYKDEIDMEGAKESSNLDDIYKSKVAEKICRSDKKESDGSSSSRDDDPEQIGRDPGIVITSNSQIDSSDDESSSSSSEESGSDSEDEDESIPKTVQKKKSHRNQEDSSDDDDDDDDDDETSDDEEESETEYEDDDDDGESKQIVEVKKKASRSTVGSDEDDSNSSDDDETSYVQAASQTENEDKKICSKPTTATKVKSRRDLTNSRAPPDIRKGSIDNSSSEDDDSTGSSDEDDDSWIQRYKQAQEADSSSCSSSSSSGGEDEASSTHHDTNEIMETPKKGKASLKSSGKKEESITEEKIEESSSSYF